MTTGFKKKDFKHEDVQSVLWGNTVEPQARLIIG